MKIKIVIGILAAACLALAIVLFVIKNRGDEQHATDVNSIIEFSNQVVSAEDHLKELGQVNLTLSNDLASSEQQVTLDEAQMAQLSNNLATADTALAETKSSLAGAEETVTNLNSRIADLENENKALDLQAQSLSNRLERLTAQIEDTKNHLAIAETNAAFLQGELEKQLAQKAELEHKFNDLDELRNQVRRLKDEMFVARRIELMKNDTGNKKGGEMLMNHKPSSAGSKTNQPPPNYNLNVEVGSDGTVKVIPPLEGTNSPAR
jgi:polyhydroxyalkanoate synthesis regulator phasin